LELGTGAVGGSLKASGTAVRWIGTGYTVLDSAGNAVMVGTGGADMIENGVTLGNASKVIGGTLGVTGNIVGASSKSVGKAGDEIVEGVVGTSTTGSVKNAGSNATGITSPPVTGSANAAEGGADAVTRTTTGMSDAAKTFEVKISQQALSTGAKGEQIAADMLKQNGWTDFQYIKNTSDNGIDIIARGPDGHLGFFEVKTTSVGKIPNLSARQSDMTEFVQDVLTNAANGTGKYQNVDQATRNAAVKLLEEIRANPRNITGTAIGVDLQNGVMRVSSWPRN
jgi:Holliday junction resolvase-like predicted endonuclease